MLKKFNLKKTVSAVSVVALPVLTGTAFAEEAGGIDLSAITGAFNAASVITAVMAVAAVLASIYATMTAAKMALRWIRGG